jgi:hypothetical protein
MSLAARFVFLFTLAGSQIYAGRHNETKLRVAVPDEISERASAVLAGRAPEFTPILMLTGLEVGEAEGLTFEVRAASTGDSLESGPVLAVSGLEGHRQESPQNPLRKMDLPVPLNHKALEFLAGKKEVTFVLRLRNAGARPPLTVDHASLLTK